MDGEDYDPNELVDEESEDDDVSVDNTKPTVRKSVKDSSRVNPLADEEEDEDDDDEDDDDEEPDNDILSEVSETDIMARLQPNIADGNRFVDSDEDDSDEEAADNNYLQRFDNTTRQNILSEFHPELHNHNQDEIANMCTIVRDAHGTPIDLLHRTIPILTRYEKARVLGERAKQINSGAKPFTIVDDNIIDGYLIALKELEEKKMPFIIKRPMPNGGCEYWKLSDLEILV
jgi:DNA-directed RNA polymerase I, II, and III subunit RPABC2